MKTTYKFIVLILLTMFISCSSDEGDNGGDDGNGGNNNNNNLFSEITVLSNTDEESIDFGRGFPEHDEISKYFKITNLGDAVLNISTITVPNGFNLVETFSATVLNPSASITLEIKFTPILEQEYTGNIVVSSDADSGINTLSLTGLGSKKVVDFDGNQYNMVKIGTRLWLKENFRGTHFANGDPIPNYLEYTNANLDETYGKFYTWEACFYWNSALDRPVTKLLMAGFSVPSNYRWNLLFNELGGTNVAGGKMKVTDTDLWDAPNTGATNVSGFSAIPSGSVSPSQTLFGVGEYAAFWSYKQEDPEVFDFVYSTRIFHDTESLDFYHNHFTGYYSIRLYR